MARFWRDTGEMLAIVKERLYTPVVGDILDQMGFSHQFLPAELRPLSVLAAAGCHDEEKRTEDSVSLAGFACTVLENDVYGMPKKPFGYLTEALDQLRPNEIYVATGAHHSALWGELLTAAAKARGAAGAVLDGYSRDTPQVLSQKFPVFCRQCWAQDSSIRTYVCDMRCTIEIGQVTIHDGDLIFGDLDGVLAIPGERIEEVLERALEKASQEKLVRKAIEGGMTATEAFRKFGVL